MSRSPERAGTDSPATGRPGDVARRASGRAVLAVYVSRHGFGHAVRVASVLEALLRREAGATVHVRSPAPSWIFPPRARRERGEPVDVGVAQADPLEVDLARTRAELDALESAWPRRVEEEAAWLRRTGARLVLADVPPLAFAAAARARVPAVALGNFTWDWIYRSYAEEDPAFARHAERAAEACATAELALRLPFHAGFGGFPAVRDVPLIARRETLAPREARRTLGLPEEGPLVLVSFGGIGPGAFRFGALGAVRGVRFVTTDRVEAPPGNLIVRDRTGRDYVRLLRACDAVVTKPGWGITAAALVNGVRVLYAPRRGFPEDAILAAALERHGTASRLDGEAMRAGDLGGPLEALLRRPVREAPLPGGGEEAVAAELLGRLA